MKYVIYARRSTEDREDRQIISIESQVEAVKAKFPDIEIVEVITESKSAYKAFNRPEFQRMVKMFESGKVQGLIAWHPDRLSREPISAGIIIHLLDRGLIKDMKFASYNFDNSPEGKMMLSLVLSQSKYFSEKLSIDVKRGMLKKCTMGYRPGLPPIGYKTDPFREKGEKRTLVDEERFPLVRKLWDTFLTGEYSVPELEVLAERWGLKPRSSKNRPAGKLTTSVIYKILQNPFYAGSFEWDGQMYEGKHEAMITWEEFHQGLALFGKRASYKIGFVEAPYSGMFRCECGELMYVDTSVKHRGKGKPLKRYFYLRCKSQKKGKRMDRCGNRAISVALVEKQVRAFLRSIEISPAFESWMRKHVGTILHLDGSTRESELMNVENAYRDCVKRIERLTKALIGGLIDEQEFKQQKKALFIEKAKTFAAKERLDNGLDNAIDTIENIFSFAKTAHKAFSEGDLKKRHSILAKTGANFIINDQKVLFKADERLLRIKKHLPEVRRLEALCEPPENGEFMPKNSIGERLITVWSSLWYEVRTFSSIT